jgi:hypothetical protein
MADGWVSPSAISIRRFDSPHFPPRFSFIISRQRHCAVRRKVFDASEQPADQAWQMGKMTGDRDVARFRAQSVLNPLRRVVRLHVADCRRARTPQLSASSVAYRCARRRPASHRATRRRRQPVRLAPLRAWIADVERRPPDRPLHRDESGTGTPRVPTARNASADLDTRAHRRESLPAAGFPSAESDTSCMD